MSRDSIAGSPAFVPAGPYNWKFIAAGLFALLVLAVGLGFHWFRSQPVASSRIEHQLTHAASENRLLGAAISPDGKHLAFTDTKGLHLSVIETGEVHDIALPDEIRTHLWDVNWFPDGERLLLSAEAEEDGSRTIWMMSIFGGNPRKLRTHSDGATVSADGSAIALIGELGHELWFMGPNGENPQKILASEKDRYLAAAWSPKSERLAYIRVGEGGSATIETMQRTGGTPSTVLSDPNLQAVDLPPMCWLRDGRLIFELNDPLSDTSNLWEISVDPHSGQPSGKPSRITNWEGVFVDKASVSLDGHRLAAIKGHIRDDVYVGELKDAGNRLASPRRLTVSDSTDYVSGWTHDSKAILFSSNRTGRTQIFKQALDHESPDSLIAGSDDEDGAMENPDGKWILYWSSAHAAPAPSKMNLMRYPAAGGSPQSVLEATDTPTDFRCPMAPTSSCLISRWEKGALIFYDLDPVQGQGKELARTRLASAEEQWCVSNDGLHVAVFSWDQLPHEIRILDLAAGTEKTLQLPQGWKKIWGLTWSPEGNALFVTAARSSEYFLAHVDLSGKTHELLNFGRNNWLGRPHVSPNGRYLAFSVQTFDFNAWLLQDF